MICSQCSTDNPERARFCRKCTARLPSESPREQPAEAPLSGERHSDGPERFVGQTLGGCRVRKLLGSGALGSVYLAEQIEPARKVALRVLSAGFSARRDRIDDFQRETRTLAGLKHPNILPIYGMFEVEGSYFVVTRFVPEGTARKLLRRPGRVPQQQVRAIALQVARGLGAAAQRGIVHRDIKPDNLMLTRQGDVQIAEFGLTRGQTRKSLTHAGATPGTPGYRAPELWRSGHKVEHSADLYALGCTLYELLTGALPFAGPSTPEFEQQHLYAEPPDPRIKRPDLAPGLARIVTRLLQKNARDRFASAAELAEALESLPAKLADNPREPRNVPAPGRAAHDTRPLALPPKPPAQPISGVRGWAWVAGLLVLAAGVYFIQQRWLRSGPEVPATPGSAEPELEAEQPLAKLRFIDLAPVPGTLLMSDGGRRRLEIRGRLECLGPGRLPDALWVDGSPQTQSGESFSLRRILDDGINSIHLQAAQADTELVVLFDPYFKDGLAHLNAGQLESANVLLGASRELRRKVLREAADWELAQRACFDVQQLLAGIARKRGDTNREVALLNECLPLGRGLLQQQPRSVELLSPMAATLARLGEQFLAFDSQVLARASFLDSCELWLRLLELDPEAGSACRVVPQLTALAEHFLAEDELELALECQQQGARLGRALVSATPARASAIRELAELLEALASTLAITDEKQAALEAMQESVRLRQLLEK